ncbi:MAG TPA: peptidase U32 [Desulfobacteraceae bacterium]|nr:peptidase U32 [Desulfobacteraceae bacterium]
MDNKKINKVELLAPAGNLEKLEIAIHYGADAVYLAGKDFSLRNLSDNFTIDELETAVTFAHARGVKVYVACNVFARNPDLNGIKEFLHNLAKISPDAVIIADPGVFLCARDIIPQIPVHLSTQANTTNAATVLFWENLGAKRVNVARELSLKEIKQIAGESHISLEAFVHGAICISYSGRCLLSSFMSGRDSNQGRCSHPCRWKYSLVEDLRPGEYLPISEDNRGSYIFNSHDLCMIEHVDKMIDAGVTSLKIEGRMKGINYLASTVKVYREAIDLYYENPDNYSAKQDWINELAIINNRGYCTGFYLNNPDHASYDYADTDTFTTKLFVAKVIEPKGDNHVLVDVRNKIFKGDIIEVLTKKGPGRDDKIYGIKDDNGLSIPFAQPGSRVTLELAQTCFKNELMRKSIKDG